MSNRSLNIFSQRKIIERPTAKSSRYIFKLVRIISVMLTLVQMQLEKLGQDF